MGTMRVTQRMMVDRVLNNLGAQSRRILDLQEQLATGLRVNRPSDDPLAARRAVNARTEISKNDQYLTNISGAGPTLIESETAARTAIDGLQRAKELTLQGGSTTMGQVQRDQLAIEINQILETVLAQANSQTNGRHLFGGTRTLTTPFAATRDAGGEITAVTYQGNDGRFEIEIADGVRVPINEPGDRVFQDATPDGVDVFQMLLDIRENLRNGDIGALEDRIGELNRAQDQLLISVSRLGSVQNRLDRAELSTREISVQLEKVLSDSIDAEFEDVILNLNAQTNAFQAALNAGARVIQPSLLDFVR